MQLRTHLSKVCRFLIALVFSAQFFQVPDAWALYPPEPQSGGYFDVAKGTRSSDDYRLLGRTGAYDPLVPSEDTGIRLGNGVIRPYAAYTGVLDSNVFLTDEDTEEDYINRLNWGVDAEVPLHGGKYVARGALHSESEWFVDQSSEDHTDWTYQMGFGANFTGAKLELFDEFQKTTERSGGELTERVERMENFLTGLITVPFGQFFQETELSHYVLEFDAPDFAQFDRQEYRFVPRVGVDVNTRTQLLLEYGLTHIDYDIMDDRNGEAHSFMGGVRGYLGGADYITYQVWAGWEVRKYDSGARDDFSGFVFRAKTEYRPSRYTKAYVEVRRRPVESVTQTNSFIVRNEVVAGVDKNLTEKLVGRVRGGAAILDYSNGREDTLFEPSAGLDYQLVRKRVRLFTEYRYTNRMADANANDYTRHLLSFGVRGEF